MRRKLSQVANPAELRQWFEKRFKRTNSTTPFDEMDDLFQHQLIQDINLDLAYFEHTLTMEQLSDMFPLSRVCMEEPEQTRGLNKDEIMARLSRDGRNIVCPVREKYRWRTFVNIFAAVVTFRMLLLLAALTCFIIFLFDRNRMLELYLMIILLGVFLALCLISYWQEQSAIREVRGFKSIIPTSCVVIRSGRRQRVNATGIVVGDVVCISSGARVPADLRLIYTNSLYLETSWISGLADPLEFSHHCVPKNVSPLSAQNIAFNGCLCVRGEGLGIVIKTGNDTVIGKLMEITTQEQVKKTRLELEHKRFVTFIIVLAFVLATVTFLLGFIMNHFQHFLTIFINGFLVICVANVPQGLPITLGAALIIVSRRLAKKGLYMKRLDVVETLGTATVLMTDKRGVLTSNDITVTDVWHHGRFFKGPIVDEQSYIEVLENRSNETNGPKKHTKAILTTMCLCNKAQIEVIGSGSVSKWKQSTMENDTMNDISKWLTPSRPSSMLQPDLEQQTVQRTLQLNSIRATFRHKNIAGNPTEVALLKYVEEMVSVQTLRSVYEVVHEIPFDGRYRIHVVIARPKQPIKLNGRSGANEPQANDDEEDELIRYFMFVKGAPEDVLMRCTTMATLDGDRHLNESLVNEFTEAYMKLGSEGRTCLAFATAEFDGYADECFTALTPNTLLDYELCFLGMAALYDPPRETAQQSIQALRDAGVKCFMISGDHPSTATTLAKHIGLLKDDSNTKATGNGNCVPASTITPITTSSNGNTGAACSAPASTAAELQNVSVIHGEMLKTLTPDQWDEILAQRAVVFARTTPAQKLIIVEECQKRKEVVAVTGDGVFDAPALKKANVGIALEAVGSVFAKEAADMVLIDNDLRNIVKGIAEGRLLYANLKKTIAYTLTHLMPELYAVLFTFIVGFPLGLSSLQIVTIDLITELPPSIALTFEPGERDIMRRIPRKTSAKLVSRALLAYSYLFAGNIVALGCLLAYLSVFWYYHITPRDLLFSSHTYWNASSPNFTTHSGGYVFTAPMQTRIHCQAKAAWQITLVMAQAFHLWMCTTRRISIFQHGFRNIVAAFAILLEILILNFFVYTPGVQQWIGVDHPPAFVWLFCLAVAVCLLVFNEVRKYFIRRYPEKPIVRMFKW